MRRFVFFLVGLLLLVYGLEGPLLGVVGASSTAMVSAVSRTGKSTARDYRVQFRFRSEDGKEHTGAFIRSGVYDTTALPKTGSTLALRYLRAAPGINLSAAEAGLNPGRLGAMAVGAAVIVLALLGFDGRFVFRR